MTREPFKDKPYRLVSKEVVSNLKEFLDSVPIDPEKPIQVMIREEPKKRSISMNDAMWAGPLADIEKQAIHEEKQYPAKVWHEFLKDMFLPDEINDFDFDPKWVLEGYQKWGTNPFNGQRILTGSTTQLTPKGMKIYLLQVESFMAGHPYMVQFTTKKTPEGRP